MRYWPFSPTGPPGWWVAGPCAATRAEVSLWYVPWPSQKTLLPLPRHRQAVWPYAPAIVRVLLQVIVLLTLHLQERKETTIERIPITSNLFKDMHAMEMPRKHPSIPPSTPHSSVVPSTPHGSVPPSTPHGSDQHFVPPPAYHDSFMPHPYMQPHYSPYAMLPGPQLAPASSYPNTYGHLRSMPAIPNGLSTASQGYHNTYGHPRGMLVILDSPSTASQGYPFCVASSSPPPACELDDYCDSCGHNAVTKAKLEALGFILGDLLDKIPSVEFKKVGFKYLEWGHVVKADKVHRLLAKAQRWWRVRPPVPTMCLASHLMTMGHGCRLCRGRLYFIHGTWQYTVIKLVTCCIQHA